MSETDDPLYSHRIRFSNTSRIFALLAPDVRAAGESAGSPEDRLIARLPATLHRASPLKRAQYLESTTFLQGYLLHTQGDRMLMGNAVEGRFPYLDFRLAELAARVPDRFLLRGLREKSLLREALGQHLPPEITNRVKHPYRAPILEALAGPEAPEWVAELTLPKRVAAAGVLDAGAVDALLTKCRARVAQGVSETDEMALVGVLSVLLLHEHLIAHPRLSARAIPNREVEGSTVCTLD